MHRFFLALCCCGVTALSCAGENRIPHYIVGVENTRYSPQYDHDGDQFLGYAREFLDEFARQHGIEFEYRVLPINRLYHVFLVEQTVDFKYPDSPVWRPELRQAKSVFYSDACAEFTDGVMVLPQNKGAGLAQLKTLGIVRGFTAKGYEMPIAQGHVKLDENGNTSGLLQKTLRHRIDGAHINVDVARFHLRQVLRQPYALVFDKELPFHHGAYVLASLKYPQRITEMNEFIAQNREWIAELKKRYRIGME